MTNEVQSKILGVNYSGILAIALGIWLITLNLLYYYMRSNIP